MPVYPIAITHAIACFHGRAGHWKRVIRILGNVHTVPHRTPEVTCFARRVTGIVATNAIDAESARALGSPGARRPIGLLIRARVCDANLAGYTITVPVARRPARCAEAIVGRAI